MKIIKGDIAILEDDTHICKWVKQEGRLDHDQNMLPFVMKHIKTGDLVIDVGAYVGDHTLAYSDRVGHNGRVIAFEPNNEAFECLVYNLGRRNNCELRNEAVGSGGKVVLIKCPDNIGMTYVQNSKNGFEAVAIDSLNLNRCDFIKIDCEGFEMEVLKSAIDIIERFKPKLLIEVNTYALSRNGITREDIFNFLDSYGYKYENIYPGQSLYDEQIDIICI